VSPEARLLRYFLSVADELNFTRAAERLNIAQPALSAQIRQLEAQLGVQLLERTTRSVSLTDAGRAMHDRGPAALAALEEVWEAARRAGRGEAGRLRIAYSPSAGYDTAPRLVEALRERYPRVEVAAEVLPTPEIVRAVLDGRADVGVARMPLPADGVRLRTVRVERQGVLVPADHPLANRPEVELAAVAEHPILVHPRAANPAHHDLLIDLFRRARLEPRLVERPVAFDPTQRMIRDGRAIGLVGASSAVGLADRLRWVPLADPAPRLEVKLVLRDGEPSPLADRFERATIAYAAAAGWLDAPPGI
jgi:DNA-binding transcriptional LysR family regulator